jgi:hypothetical protein
MRKFAQCENSPNAKIRPMRKFAKCGHPSREHVAIARHRRAEVAGSSPARGRCYDHNFLRFLTIFGEKIGVFLKNQWYDQIFT